MNRDMRGYTQNRKRRNIDSEPAAMTLKMKDMFLYPCLLPADLLLISHLFSLLVLHQYCRVASKLAFCFPSAPFFWIQI